MTFSREFAVVPTAEGVLRCLPSGLCNRLRAFGRGGTVRALWISPAGTELWLVKDGRLGHSSDGGETAIWQNLPVTNERVNWLDVVESAATAVYLGSATGLFVSRDGGARWERIAAGLPEGRMESWLRTSKFWLATEGEGGVYLSADRGNSWQRIDRDSERGRIAGLVLTKGGTVLAGSQSEGLLRLETDVPERSR